MTYDVIKNWPILETGAFYTAGIGQIQEIKRGSNISGGKKKVCWTQLKSSTTPVLLFRLGQSFSRL